MFEDSAWATWETTNSEDDAVEDGELGSASSDAFRSVAAPQRTTDTEDSQDTPWLDPSRRGENGSTSSSLESSRPMSSRPVSSGPRTKSECERRYGVEIETPGDVETLQRLEETHGLGTIREWAEEGIPIGAMGSKSDMAVFRERKGTPVPWDIEQRNEQSKRRNTVVQRMTGPAGETGEVPDRLRTALSSPGRKLDQAVRERKEAQFETNFEHVRFHTGPRARAATEAIDAEACTVGNHVFVNDPDFDPQSPRGEYVLTHELAHVDRQTDGTVSRLPKDDAGLQIESDPTLAVDPDPQLEREAHETARRVLRGGSPAAGTQRTTDAGVSVQRMDSSPPTSGHAGSNEPDGPLSLQLREHRELAQLWSQVAAAAERARIVTSRYREIVDSEADIPRANLQFSQFINQEPARRGEMERLINEIHEQLEPLDERIDWYTEEIRSARAGQQNHESASNDLLPWVLAELDGRVGSLSPQDRSQYRRRARASAVAMAGMLTENTAAAQTRNELNQIADAFHRRTRNRGASRLPN